MPHAWPFVRHQCAKPRQVRFHIGTARKRSHQYQQCALCATRFLLMETRARGGHLPPPPALFLARSCRRHARDARGSAGLLRSGSPAAGAAAAACRLQLGSARLGLSLWLRRARPAAARSPTLRRRRCSRVARPRVRRVGFVSRVARRAGRWPVRPSIRHPFLVPRPRPSRASLARRGDWCVDSDDCYVACSGVRASPLRSGSRSIAEPEISRHSRVSWLHR